MPWTPKAGAPATFNLGDAVAALITGDATWGWLLDWLPMLPPVNGNTAALCAAGPQAIPTIPDALWGLDPAADIALAVLRLPQLWAALQAASYDRVFQAYCEDIVPATSGCTFYNHYSYAGGAGLMYWEFQTPIGPTDHFEFDNVVATGPGSPTLRVITYRADLSIVLNTFFGMATGGAYTWGSPFPADVTSFTLQINRSDAAGLSFDMHRCGVPAHTDTHTATPQVQPVNLPARTVNVYPDLTAVGHELDRQELKLETILAVVQLLASRGIVGPTVAAPPHDASLGPLIAGGAIGYRIDVSGIPATAGEMFGAPIKYHRIGRYTLGSANGWLPAVELSHATELVAPLPAGVDRIDVVVNAPETATITALLPPSVV